MPAVGRIVALLLMVVAMVAAEARYDWATIPGSRLAARTAALVARLQPTLAGKRCLVAPFVGTRHHLNTWAFETVAERAFVEALRGAGIAVVDDAPLRARYLPQTPGLPPTVPYSTRTITELAADCAADLVILGGCQILSESTVTVYVHGDNGRRLAKDELELEETDIDLPALTPAANRAVVTWAEAQLDRRAADGTASGFAAAALAGGRALPPPRTIPLPGDVILWWERTRFRWLRRPRAAIVYAVLEPARVEVIVQGWHDGQRRVGVERVQLDGFRFGLLRPTAAP
jgi:hypothetical protein